MSDSLISDLASDVVDALWIRDQWLQECHERIRMLNAVLQEWEIVHPWMLRDGEVLPGDRMALIEE